MGVGLSSDSAAPTPACTARACQATAVVVRLCLAAQARRRALALAGRLPLRTVLGGAPPNSPKLGMPARAGAAGVGGGKRCELPNGRRPVGADAEEDESPTLRAQSFGSLLRTRAAVAAWPRARAGQKAALTGCGHQLPTDRRCRGPARLATGQRDLAAEAEAAARRRCLLRARGG